MIKVEQRITSIGWKRFIIKFLGYRGKAHMLAEFKYLNYINSHPFEAHNIELTGRR